MNYIAESTFEARPVFALSFVDRLRGLLGHDRKLHKNEVLCIMPCKSIHTYGMRYSIDVAFINERGTVIETLCNVNPNQHCKCKHAKWVIERYSCEDP